MITDFPFPLFTPLQCYFVAPPMSMFRTLEFDILLQLDLANGLLANVIISTCVFGFTDLLLLELRS